jgi:C_GCAxxG_C_C family probable redox protein
MSELEKITRKYWIQHNCAISTSCALLEYHDLDIEQTKRSLLTFGGGMGEGSICGAVTGSMVAINLLSYNQSIPVEEIRRRNDQFKQWFAEEFGSLNCGDMLLRFKDSRGNIIQDAERREHCTNCVIRSVVKVQELVS